MNLVAPPKIFTNEAAARKYKTKPQLPLVGKYVSERELLELSHVVLGGKSNNAD